MSDSPDHTLGSAAPASCLLRTYADGHVEGSRTMYSGNQVWEQILGGDFQTYTVDDELPAPFAASSAAVVTAALGAGDVADLGQEQVGGVEATHYRIEADAAARQALGELSPGQLGWFELEYPAGVRTIDICVADDLIRRVGVVQETGVGADTPDVGGPAADAGAVAVRQCRCGFGPGYVEGAGVG